MRGVEEEGNQLKDEPCLNVIAVLWSVLSIMLLILPHTASLRRLHRQLVNSNTATIGRLERQSAALSHLAFVLLSAQHATRRRTRPP
jgi:hypothetical protein